MALIVGKFLKSVGIVRTGNSPRRIEHSISSISSHLPGEALESLRPVIESIPVSIHVTRVRQSKLGDHRLSADRTHSIITVNGCGNKYQFLVTLLHELAHAQVVHRYVRRVPAHGRQWKNAFARLLLERLHVFPEDLRAAVRNYAANPLYSTLSDPRLSALLRIYDLADPRPTVDQLVDNQRFSLNGKIMIRGELLRKRYRCADLKGRMYYVNGSARVEVV